jgi:hypothetical protein
VQLGQLFPRDILHGRPEKSHPLVFHQQMKQALWRISTSVTAAIFQLSLRWENHLLPSTKKYKLSVELWV